MKVVENTPSSYKVNNTQWGVFLFTLFGIIFGVAFFSHNNVVGVASCLIGFGALLLPIKTEVKVDTINKKIIVSSGGLLGIKNKEYQFSEIKKFTLTKEKQDLSFNVRIFSDKGFVEYVRLLPASSSAKTSFYLTGYTPQSARTNIPNYDVFKKIADLCGKELAYEDAYELAQEFFEKFKPLNK